MASMREREIQIRDEADKTEGENSKFVTKQIAAGMASAKKSAAGSY
jgi:hypothetical protein